MTRSWFTCSDTSSYFKQINSPRTPCPHQKYVDINPTYS